MSRHRSGIPNAAKGFNSKVERERQNVHHGIDKKPSYNNLNQQNNQNQNSLQQYHLN
jgi:hypothetical protein